MHENTTSAFNVNYKMSLHTGTSSYIGSFIKCGGESYK